MYHILQKKNVYFLHGSLGSNLHKLPKKAFHCLNIYLSYYNDCLRHYLVLHKIVPELTQDGLQISIKKSHQISRIKSCPCKIHNCYIYCLLLPAVELENDKYYKYSLYYIYSHAVTYLRQLRDDILLQSHS